MIKVDKVPLTQSDLKEYLGVHVKYEFSMLLSSASLLLSLDRKRLTEYGKAVHGDSSDDFSKIVSSLFLEGFVLHLRNILDFLYFEREDPSRKPKKSDVVAEHYYAGMARPSKFPPISDGLIDARRRADKELAHLTAERLPEGSPHRGWDYIALLREIGERLDCFCRFCDKNLLDERLVQVQTLYPWHELSSQTP